MNDLRKPLLVVLATLTLGVLAGCAPSTNESTEPTTPAVEQPSELPTEMPSESAVPTVAP